MITASLVLYKSKIIEVKTVLECVDKSIIDVVYVVDNSPTDTLRDVVYVTSKKVEYIYGQGNLGFGEGNNLAIKKAQKAGSIYHIVLNPDIIFCADSIQRLYSYMELNPEVGLVKPALVHKDGSFNASAMLLPTPLLIFGKRFLPPKMREHLTSHFYLMELDLSKTMEVPNFSGSFLFFRMETLEIAGAFDDRYFMYFEDFDLVRRIHKISKIMYYPEVTIVHAHAAEHKTNKKLLWAGFKSGVKYFNKWGWFFDRDRKNWNKQVFEQYR